MRGWGAMWRSRSCRLCSPQIPTGCGASSRRREPRQRSTIPIFSRCFRWAPIEGAPYLVSELLEGETLREQIKRGRLSVRKAIDYGVQIARGLAAAHEKGIVHRDLKPENLFVTKDGRVKILDFGLAKLTQPQSSSEHSAPTLTQETEAGVVMGTVGYMSPEQVRGQTADHRADIFAFGAILYEMLAGKRAFQKPTSPETMSAILNEDPPGISQVTPNIPPAMQRVVHRSLEKNPEQRFQSASDLAFALDALSESSSNASALSSKEPWRLSKRWAVAAGLVAVVAVALWLWFRTPRRPEPKHALVERQLTANPAENQVGSAAISRDGKYLAYIDESKNLYLLAIDSGEIRQLPLPATRRLYQVIDWFPDGSHVLLLGGGVAGDLYKMSTWDSSVRKLWGGNVVGGVVSLDGSHIAFLRDEGGIWLMGADGEEPHQILAGAEFPGGNSLAWSPNGQRLAYIRAPGDFSKRQATIETCDLAGGARTLVLSDPDLLGPSNENGIFWLPDGRIIYAVQVKAGSQLRAIPADPRTGNPSGSSALLADWKGFQVTGPQASADGKRLTVAKSHTDVGIYIGNLASGHPAFTPHRLTLDAWHNAVWSWTKDSKAVLFESKRNGKWSIFKQNVDATTAETLISGSENNFYPVMTAEGTILYSATVSDELYDPNDATMRLMSTPLQGGARSTLLMGSYYYACGSSQSSSCVLSELKDKQLTFFHLDPVNGKGDEIARIDGYGGTNPEWDLSPDGSNIAIADESERTGKIRVLNVAGRKLTVLPVRDWKWQFLQQITWAADGKHLFALAPSTSAFSLLSIDEKGNPRVLYEIPGGTGWIASIVPSPDGRSLAFTKRTFVNDVMLLENF